MKQILNKLLATVSFMMVFCLHVYFVLLVGTKPALAAQTDQQGSVVKVGLMGAESKTIAKKEIKETATSEEQAGASALANDDDGDETTGKGINIKINGEDGITISGSESLVKQLKDLEKTIEAKVNDRETLESASYSFGRTLENILVPVMIVLITFGFAGYVVYSKQKTRKEYLETIRTLAQNNQPIPQELLHNLNSNDFGLEKSGWNGKYSDASSVQGIKYLFIGLGVAGFMILLDRMGPSTAIGFIFITIGVFHILKSQLIQKQIETKKAQTVATVPAPTNTTTPQA